MLDECDDAALVVKIASPAGAVVFQPDVHAGIEKRQFPQAGRQRFVMKGNVAEDFFRRPEPDGRPGALGRACRCEIAFRPAHGILLVPPLPIAVDDQVQALGQGVHDGNPHPVQAAGDLVGVFVELPSRMQGSHYQFGRRAAFFVHFDRNPAPVVDHRHRTVFVQGHQDLGAMSLQGLVDRVVDNLKYHMV